VGAAGESQEVIMKASMNRAAPGLLSKDYELLPQIAQ
jgi:hypothetical protein